jgi:pSer/pThr/pTyr-binding forkhead associated (FHA) protein
MAFLYRIDDVEGDLSDCWAVHDRPLVVGRGEVANVRVADDSLSRSHFMVTAQAGHFLLVDLQSRNGTWVNGDQVVGRKLISGELIRAGKTLFYFSRDKVQTPAALMERLPGGGDLSGEMGIQSVAV